MPPPTRASWAQAGAVKVDEWGVLKMKNRCPAPSEAFGIDDWTGHFSNARIGAPPVVVIVVKRPTHQFVFLTCAHPPLIFLILPLRNAIHFDITNRAEDK
jgi:hypothetical protein